MRSEWRETKVAELGKIVTGKTPKTAIANNYGGKIPFLTPSDDMSVKFVSKTAKTITDIGLNEVINSLLPANSVCVSCIGSDLGKVVISRQPMVTNQQINSIIVDQSKYDVSFVYYAMLILGKKLNFISKTSTAVPIVNKSSFSNYTIHCPPLEKQRRIASVLSVLDDKIELNQNMYWNLQQQLKTLAKSWLVDYLPFGGVMPDTWTTIPLSFIADFVSGYTYKSVELQPSTTAMATIKNFNRNGGFKLDGFKELIPSSKIKPSHYAEKFDIIVAHTDLTQKAEVIGNAEPILNLAGYDAIVFSMDLVKVTPRPGISKFLLAVILQDPRFKAHCLGYVNGTTVLHLNKRALPEYELVFPLDAAILKPLDNVVQALYTQMANIVEENRQLITVRDTLLPKLMSGKINI